MSPEEIFSMALEKSAAADRQEFLDAACGDDRALRSEVESLLMFHERAGDFLNDPCSRAPNLTTSGDVPPKSDLLIGTWIGPYQLTAILGQGGMGVVYEAEQSVPVRRTVALKIVNAELATRSVLSRFEAERQVLALMDHPNIARVIDAGATAEGRPWFAMERVNGIPITDYCRQEALTIQQRLALMVSVCQGVQHAHQKGIIHRDLKPSNILVARLESGPIPKVIDFGIAKALAASSFSATLQTSIGAVLGTLEYMSPEQAGLNPRDIDTRSDVYSLGIILYELLTGATPLGGKQRNVAEFLEALRVIRESDPPKPSTRRGDRLSTRRNPSSPPMENSDPPGFIPSELDWIVMRALEKDRSRRYQSAQELADDMTRFLRHEPILAGPPSASYRVRKFIRRHRLLVAAVTLIFLAMAAGLLGTGWGFWMARKEAAEKSQALRNEQQALSQARRDSLRVWEALRTLTDSVVARHLSQQRKLDQTDRQFLKSIIDQYAAFADDRTDDLEHRHIRAMGLYRVGRLHSLLGEHTVSRSDLAAALQLYESLLSEQPDQTDFLRELAGIHMTLAYLDRIKGAYAPAMEHSRAALQQYGRLKGQGTLHLVDRILQAAESRALAGALKETGQQQEALDLLNQSDRDLAELVANHPESTKARSEWWYTRNHLATLLQGMGRFADAEAIYPTTKQLAEELVQQDPLDPEWQHHLAVSVGNWGSILSQIGRVAEAKDQFRHALELAQALVKNFPLVPEYQFTLARTYSNAAACEGRLKNPQQAQAYSQQAQRVLATLSKNHPEFVKAQLLLLEILANSMPLERGGPATATVESAAESAIEELERRLQQNPNQVEILGLLGKTYNRQGILRYARGELPAALQQFDLAKQRFESALAIAPQDFQARLGLAGALTNLAKYSLGLDQPGAAWTHLEKAEPLLEGLLVADGRQESVVDHYRAFLANKIGSLVALDRFAEALEAIRALEEEQAAEWSAYLTVSRAVCEAYLEPEVMYRKLGQPHAEQFTNPAQCYLIAKVLAILSQELPDASQRDAARTQALELLKAAEQLGYFKNPQTHRDLKTRAYRHLSEDPTWIALMERVLRDSPSDHVLKNDGG